jgi:hypothetical protein
MVPIDLILEAFEELQRDTDAPFPPQSLQEFFTCSAPIPAEMAV